MKSNVLKSLSASAFALAIVASFAFSANNSADPVTDAYVLIEGVCEEITPPTCYINPTIPTCTKFILGKGTLDVYKERVGTNCIEQLSFTNPDL